MRQNVLLSYSSFLFLVATNSTLDIAYKKQECNLIMSNWRTHEHFGKATCGKARASHTSLDTHRSFPLDVTLRIVCSLWQATQHKRYTRHRHTTLSLSSLIVVQLFSRSLVFCGFSLLDRSGLHSVHLRRLFAATHALSDDIHKPQRHQVNPNHPPSSAVEHKSADKDVKEGTSYKCGQESTESSEVAMR